MLIGCEIFQPIYPGDYMTDEQVAELPRGLREELMVHNQMWEKRCPK